MTLPNTSTCCSVTFSPLFPTTALQQQCNFYAHTPHIFVTGNMTLNVRTSFYFGTFEHFQVKVHILLGHINTDQELINYNGKINSRFQSSTKTLQLARWDFAYMCNFSGMHNYVCIHMLSFTLFRQLHSDPRGWQLSQIRTQAPATDEKKKKKRFSFCLATCAASVSWANRYLCGLEFQGKDHLQYHLTHTGWN